MAEPDLKAIAGQLDRQKHEIRGKGDWFHLSQLPNLVSAINTPTSPNHKAAAALVLQYADILAGTYVVDEKGLAQVRDMLVKAAEVDPASAVKHKPILLEAEIFTGAGTLTKTAKGSPEALADAGTKLQNEMKAGLATFFGQNGGDKDSAFRLMADKYGFKDADAAKAAFAKEVTPAVLSSYAASMKSDPKAAYDFFAQHADTLKAAGVNLDSFYKDNKKPLDEAIASIWKGSEPTMETDKVIRNLSAMGIDNTILSNSLREWAGRNPQQFISQVSELAAGLKQAGKNDTAINTLLQPHVKSAIDGFSRTDLPAQRTSHTPKETITEEIGQLSSGQKPIAEQMQAAAANAR